MGGMPMNHADLKGGMSLPVPYERGRSERDVRSVRNNVLASRIESKMKVWFNENVLAERVCSLRGRVSCDDVLVG